MEEQPIKDDDKTPPVVFNGTSWEDIPAERVASCLMSPDVFAAFTGPEDGLVAVETEGKPLPKTDADLLNNGEVAGCRNWNLKSRKAYGICLSLYDQNPVNKKMSGDPIADSFAICARKNNAILICADGVNWGEKSRMAARAAVYGAMKYLNQKLFQEKRQLDTTQDAIKYLRNSFDVAHKTIMDKEGGLTTLCAAFVCPLQDSKKHAICCVNVGDSFAFVFSKRWGLREITVGSHDIQSERDIRDAGGALGPVDGENPELNNLTCSMTFVDPSDVVFLTTDGISDNFDPVVTKIARAMKPEQEKVEEGEDGASVARKPVDLTKPPMWPHERHQYSVKEMERYIHEFELLTEIPCSAQEICGALVQHVCMLTDPKRKVLEDPSLYIKRKMKSKERKRRDSEIVSKMAKAPGKLDHATIVAYEVGVYRSEDDENTNYDTVTPEADLESEKSEKESISSKENCNNIPNNDRISVRSSRSSNSDVPKSPTRLLYESTV